MTDSQDGDTPDTDGQLRSSRIRISAWRRLLIALISITCACVFVGCAGVPSTTHADPRAVQPEPTAQVESDPAPTPPVEEPAPVITTTAVRVTKIVDGDTIWVELPDGTTDKVRFIGVDTPESTNRIEPFGAEASAYTRNALSGKTVYLETDAGLRDKYDRLLAHIWLEVPDTLDDAEVRAHLFNAHLLLAGYANLMTIPPNVKYVDYLRGYEAEARTASTGLWAPAPAPTPAPVAPAAQAPPASAPVSSAYIANRNTGKFHHASCSSVGDMNPSNKVPYDSRDQAAAAGYIPCKRCNP